MHNWSTFDAWTYTNSLTMAQNLGEPINFSFILFSMISHKGCIKMSFCRRTLKLGVPKFLKFPKLGLLALLKLVTSCTNL